MKDLDWQNVISSNIRRMAYKEGQMFVTFTSGDTYRYDGVPEETFLAVRNAVSVGKTFKTHIKDAGFAFSKVVVG